MPSRRDFLKYSAVSLATVAGAPSLFFLPNSAFASAPEVATSVGREMVLICDTQLPNPLRTDHRPIAGTIEMYDVAARKRTTLDVPFFGHMVTQNYAHPEQVVALQKWGTMGGLVDLKQKKVLHLIESKPSSIFFGHLAFCVGGTVIACVEQGITENGGELVLRSLSDMKIIGALPTAGNYPHECCSYDGGKTIMVANNLINNQFGNVAWVDYASGKLVKKVVFEKSRFSPSHLVVTHDGWVCTSGKLQDDDHQPGIEKILSFISPTGEVYYPKFPDDLNQKMVGEGLSLAVLGKTGLLAVTLPDANMLLILDYKTQQLIDKVDLQSPRGVLHTLDAKGNEGGVIVSLGVVKELVSIDREPDHHVAMAQIFKGFGAKGSHMTRLFV